MRENNQTIEVIIIEDDEDYSKYFQILLEKSILDVNLTICNNIKEYFDTFSEVKFDIIFTSLELPDSAGINTVGLIKETTPDTPIIVLTAFDDDNLGLHLMKMGASDYLPKKAVQVKLLERLVIYTIERYKGQNKNAITLLSLYQVQKIETLGRLVLSISDDFKTIFTIISGYSEHLLRTASNESDKKILQEITNSSLQGTKLVNELIKFSNKKSVITEVFSAKHNVERICSELNTLFGKELQIELHISSDLPQLHMNRENFEQILTNLLMNAKEAMRFGGIINVVVEMKSEDNVSIKIRDTGVGISNENLDRIFEPYFSTKKMGTGMGMFFVKSIIEQQGGEISIESELNKGTTIYLEIPVRPVQQNTPVKLSELE